jgi:hypothetical protein
MKRLPVPIPRDLAGVLGIDPSYLSHVNSGRKTLSIPLACRVMELSMIDPRLAGLHFLHLRPKLAPATKWLCRPWRKNG